MAAGIADLLVIGGGINGAGIAADAAGRGLSVVLAEMGDLASGTSSASSKLIHGGLRYLEHGEFRLVREALGEREVLLARAPHIIWPLRFVLPHGAGMRPRFLIRAGLFLYDHLARRQRIPGSRAVDLGRDPAGRVLDPRFRSGFSYWDCWVDDARLVVLNARLAAARGAEIRTRTRVVRLEAGAEAWTVTVRADGREDVVRARVVVNAAGPWAGLVAQEALRANAAGSRLRLVKGSHLVVPRIAGADDAFLLQNADGRVVFVLPFETHFSLIGTTDVAFEGDPSTAHCSDAEADYLIAAANRFLARPLQRSDIVWRFAGVRPLQGDADETDPSALSRDYQLEVRGQRAGDALLMVTGGKVTTYRRLAEDAMAKLAPFFPQLGPAWTATAALPGGDLPGGDFEAYLTDLMRRRPWLPAAMARSLGRRHGTLAEAVLGDARRIDDLGRQERGGLIEREVVFFRQSEWARSPDDVLWRRTKAGLHLMEAGERDRVSDWLATLL